MLQHKPIKVYMETVDGQVFTGKAFMSALTFEQPSIEVTEFSDKARRFIPYSPIEWSMELQGTGDPAWQPGLTKATDIVSRFLPKEWQCEFCHRANLLKYQQCQSCGWYRGIVVDVAYEAGVWRV